MPSARKPSSYLSRAIFTDHHEYFVLAQAYMHDVSHKPCGYPIVAAAIMTPHATKRFAPAKTMRLRTDAEDRVRGRQITDTMRKLNRRKVGERLEGSREAVQCNQTVALSEFDGHHQSSVCHDEGSAREAEAQNRRHCACSMRSVCREIQPVLHTGASW